MTLSSVSEGKTVKIIKISCNKRIISILNDFGIIENTLIKIIKKAPFNGAIMVYSRGFTFAIREKDARLIEVAYAF